MVYETVYTVIATGCLLFIFIILRNRNRRADVNGSGEDTERERELESEQREVTSAIASVSNEQRNSIESAARSSNAERDNLISIGELIKQQQETNRAISSINENNESFLNLKESQVKRLEDTLQSEKKNSLVQKIITGLASLILGFFIGSFTTLFVK